MVTPEFDNLLAQKLPLNSRKRYLVFKKSKFDRFDFDKVHNLGKGSASRTENYQLKTIN
jgi:hypothetical protein